MLNGMPSSMLAGHAMPGGMLGGIVDADAMTDYMDDCMLVACLMA